jgi:hypothetical protein
MFKFSQTPDPINPSLSSKIRTQSQLIAYRKQKALESSQFFASNQYSVSSKRKPPELSTLPMVSFSENPIILERRLKKLKDLENFSKKFSIEKHGIHLKTLPKFSENLSLLNIKPKSLTSSPKSQKFLKVLAKEQETIKPSTSWNWLNESSDIVEFHELKRSVKIQQENFKFKRENVYSEYFTKLIKDKEIKDKLVHSIKRKHNMLIQNRINLNFKLDEAIHKSSEVRTTGFISNVVKDLY